jgi:iron complex outermembrane receptor protein
MFKLNAISAATLVALSLPLVTPTVSAQGADGQRVEITGSRIKRVAAEGPLPVEVVTREDIDRKAVASVNDLVRSLPYMSSFNDELVSNSPNTTGTAAVGFRGLGGDQSVVLLNGRRLANYGFDGAFVNLNTIPFGAVQRVEILKDGAGAIYGADAIGGVINFITRRNYRGAEITGSYGISAEGDTAETNVGGVVGFGAGPANILVNLSYFKRDPLENLDRERTNTADFRRFGGGNQLSTFAPSGNVVNPTTGLWQPFAACPSPTLVVTPSPLSPGDAASSSCVFDFAPYRTTLFGTERLGGFVMGQLSLGANTSLFSEILFARSETSASAAPAPGNFRLLAGNPNNPFTTAVTVRGRPLQAGPRITDNTSDATRILVGLDTVVAGFDMGVAVGQAKNKAENVDRGYFRLDAMNAAIAAGTFNPFSLTNPQSVIDSIKSSDTRLGETTVTFAEAKLGGELFKLPGGTAAFAAGLVVGKDEISDVPGPNSRAGNVFGSIQQSTVEATRNNSAVYAELSLPVLKSVEAQLAVRHDRYEGGTNSTTPKVALKYQPFKSFAVRGSYSEGFKMPSLRDLFGGQNQSADSVQDFPGCAARGVSAAACPRLQYDRFSGGNAQLKPEQAKSLTLGLLAEPTDNISVGVDYFVINKTDEIGLVLTQFVIDNVPYVVDATTTLGGNPAFSVTRNATGTITSVNTSLGNLGERKIQGLDLQVQGRFPTAIGRLTLEALGTYYERYIYADQPGTPLYNRLELLNLPRWRTQFRVGLNTGSWDFNVVANSRARFYDKPQSTAATPVTASTPVIGNFDTFDASIGYAGIKGLKLQLAVRNLTDRDPPFSNNDPRTLGFAQTDDVVGRYFRLSASYSF